MPKINAAMTQCYYAFDTGNSVAKTGDVANHTLRVIKDGTIGTIAASPAEVSNTLAKGLYKVVIAANENTGASMILAVESVTADIVIFPVHWTNESNMAQIAGDEQSVTDLKDFADTGYNPTTHKVAGVVLADTTTANTDMRGTDSAALATNLNDGTITLHSDYDAAKTAAQAGDAMILSAAYDAAKTAAQSGDAMDLLSATITDIQSSLLAGSVDVSTSLDDAIRSILAKSRGVSVAPATNQLTYYRDDGSTPDFTEDVTLADGSRTIA